MNSENLVDDYLGHWSTSGLHVPMEFNNKSLFEALCDLMYIQQELAQNNNSLLDFWDNLEKHVDYKVFEADWERRVWKSNEYFDWVVPGNGW